jgi:DNA-binding MarR family transcriptional regulator
MLLEIEKGKTAVMQTGSLWLDLDGAMHQIDLVYRQHLADLDVSVIGWHVLRALIARDCQHASELAGAVGRAPTSFTPILDKLEARGLIERRPDPDDRRAVFIHLTDEAQDLRGVMEARSEMLSRAVAAVLSPDECARLATLLQVIQGMESPLPATDDEPGWGE